MRRFMMRPTVAQVKTITVSGTLPASAYKNTTYQLSASVLPDNAANRAVVWSSSNTAAATINQNGVVTYRASGTVTFTAAAQDGSGVVGTKTATIAVTVYDQTFTTSGSFVCPASGDYTVTLCGGGGGGAGGVVQYINRGNPNPVLPYCGGGAGGGAGEVKTATVTLTAGVTYSVCVGLGGYGGEEVDNPFGAAGTVSPGAVIPSTPYTFNNSGAGSGGASSFAGYTAAGGALGAASVLTYDSSSLQFTVTPNMGTMNGAATGGAGGGSGYGKGGNGGSVANGTASSGNQGTAGYVKITQK